MPRGTYFKLFQLERQLQDAQGEHYFVNAPNKTTTDLIDFMLWEKKADQLGIRFNPEDVKQLIRNEFYNKFTNDIEVRKSLQQTPGFSFEACMDAIAVEFKVRAAQSAVLGYGVRYRRAVAYPSPYETFEFFREECSPARYEVIPVPAAGFVDQVKATPTEAELRDLFKQYADAEPDPKSETPGFKEPRKISIGWLGITGEEPYYKKLAAEEIKIGEVMAQASGMLTVPLPGTMAPWAMDAAAVLNLKEPAVDTEYQTYTSQFKGELRNNYHESSLPARDMMSSSVVKPGVLAATVGAFVGQAAGGGNPASAVSIAMAAPMAYEIRDRVKVGVPYVLGGVPGPAMLPTLIAGSASYIANEPKPLPIGYMRSELLEKTAIAKAKQLVSADIDRFIEELNKMTENGRPKDKAAVQKYIKEFIARRGITSSGASTAAHDEWTIEDDPGLQPLVQAQKDSLRQSSFHANQYIPFGQSLFWTSESAGFMAAPRADRRRADCIRPRDSPRAARRRASRNMSSGERKTFRQRK